MVGTRTRAQNALAVAAIGVAVFATLGEASTTKSSTSNPAPNAGQTSGSSASSGPSSSKSAPIPMGTPVEVAKGWKVQVNSANLNANAQLAQANEFNKPQAGEQFVLVNVTITNVGSRPDAALTNVKLSLLPPSGVAVSGVSSCFVSAPDKLDEMAQMQPGATQTGNVCFSPKVADVANSLLLAEPTFTMDKAEDQQYFAIQ